MTFNTFVIPNKNNFIEFYEKRQNENNLNILLYGPRESCKTTLIESIIRNFVEKYKDKCKEKQIIFRLNAFDEINLQSHHNEMSIFCQNNTNTNKIVYIDKFEFFGDHNQQLLKMYIDKYNGAKKTNKIFFIVETAHIEKVRDIIKSRLHVFKTESLTNVQYSNILTPMLENENITIDADTLDKVVNVPNMCISSLKNIVNKCKLLDYKHISSNELPALCSFIDFTIFDNFFESLKTNVKGSCDILLSLYEEGYDISDIYFFMYEYIKTQKKTNLYCIVDLLCFYINEIYNGNYSKIMLVIMTYEIQEQLVTENKVI